MKRAISDATKFLVCFRKEGQYEERRTERETQRPEFQKSANRSTAISLCAGQTVSTVAPEMDAQYIDHYNQKWDGGIW